jgi:hypothetical protein
MSYPCSMADAKAAIKAVEPDNEGDKAGSKILNGSDSGGPAAKGELNPVHYEMVGSTTKMIRRLGV